MDIMDVIKKRRSLREYSDKKIPKEALEKLVDAARFAPTARGVEPWEFVVVTKPEILKRIGEITDHGKFISKSSACIAVFCSDTKYYLEDGSAATENILLTAASLGIGSCWVAGDKKPYCEEIIKLLGVPSGFKLVSLISLGYPLNKDSFKIIDKRPVNKLAHWEKF